MEQKLLRGNVPPEVLGPQIYGCYRSARQDWANGYFDLDGFRRQALTGIFLCLAADANLTFRARLMEQISMLENASPRDDVNLG